MQTVAFIDSGIGGIPYLIHALERIPSITGLYIADTDFFPYGTRDPESLKKRLHAVVGTVQRLWNPVVYVLACNTASVVSLKYLRSSFNTTFIGTVPAVKPAVQQSKKKNISILATEQTIEDPYLADLLKKYASDHDVTLISASNLIRDIEENFFDLEFYDLKNIIVSILDSNTDTVVLGCTHFIHIRERLLKQGNNIQLIDSRDGITHQIYRHLYGLPLDRKLDRKQLSGKNITERTSFVITSFDKRPYYEAIATHFNLNFYGQMTPGT